MQETKVWVYLTKRDRKGIRFLSQFKGIEVISPTRMTEFDNLGLPASYVQQLDEVIYESRLLWESWIESAESFDEITIKLKKRGYSNLPISFIPEIGGNNFASAPIINTYGVEKTKLMVRRRV